MKIQEIRRKRIISYFFLNRSSPKRCCSNRSTPSRSKSSLQKCLSKTNTAKNICSKSASSLKSTASKSTLSSKRSNVRTPVKPDPHAKSPPVPIPIPRVSSIVVPRSRFILLFLLAPRI